MEKSMDALETPAPPKARLVGVRLRPVGALESFDPGSLQLRHGDLVIVPTESGNRLGTVTTLPSAAPPSQGPVRRVLRRAEFHDLDRLDRAEQRDRQSLRNCLEQVRDRKLPIKLVKVEQPREGGKIYVYFLSEKRVDYAGLARELAHVLHGRIELRQLGPREQAAAVGAVGPCGRELCCSTWLTSPGSVGLKMAKAQGLALHPPKLAGMCGRLKCCLRYEYDTYLELGRNLPAIGAEVESVKGSGVVVRQNLLKQTVLLQVSPKGDVVEANLEDLVQKKNA